MCSYLAEIVLILMETLYQKRLRLVVYIRIMECIIFTLFNVWMQVINHLSESINFDGGRFLETHLAPLTQTK